LVSASIGIAAVMASGEMVAEELLHLADGALYAAKRTSRDWVSAIADRRLVVAAAS
jgi:GGDEF domain-containing protein